MGEISRDKSVVFWGNYIMSAFITDRNDIWYFPMYYDLADFLLIQKDAKHSCFTANDLADLDYKKPGLQDSFYEDINKPVSGQLTAKIMEDLVNNKRTHRVAYNSTYVLVLERLEHHKFYMPESSVGFGWLKNTPKVFSKIIVGEK